jgi:hypothetical protein
MYPGIQAAGRSHAVTRVIHVERVQRNMNPAPWRRSDCALEVDYCPDLPGDGAARAAKRRNRREKNQD